MSESENARIVYSTGRGAICAGCGWPERDCRCSTHRADEPLPKRIVATLRMEKTGRRGKTVTVVDGLPSNAAFLKTLSQALKRGCGSGGAVREHGVERQGDLRKRVRAFLIKKGFVVKG